jgi:hypothetical protein
MSRKIEDCIPEIQVKFREFAVKMAEEPIPFMLTCTARDVWEHIIIMLQGRVSLQVLNDIRIDYGLYKLSEEENKERTWTWFSKHLVVVDRAKAEGLITRVNSLLKVPYNYLDTIIQLTGTKAKAFDIAILKNGKPCWEPKVSVDGDDLPDYIEAAKIGQSVGLVAGGLWKKIDPPHFEV